jgi:hypothetical protein
MRAALPCFNLTRLANCRDFATVPSRDAGTKADHHGRGGRVPRFYFHFTDGERQFSDDEGRDLAGLRDARVHATNHVRELKAAMSEPAIQDLSGWSMTVADARGRTVFVLGFDLKPRPVVPLTPDAPHSRPREERVLAKAKGPGR